MAKKYEPTGENISVAGNTEKAIGHLQVMKNKIMVGNFLCKFLKTECNCNNNCLLI
jgi:hypothetical protein